MATDAPPNAVDMRLPWIDAARGACVVAVVLYHVCLWQFLPLGHVLWQPGLVAWTTVDKYLGSVRMPVLFAISGMLAARRIRDGWSRPGAVVRAASSYYLYVMWLAVYFAFYLAFSGIDLPHRIRSFGDFLTQLLVPETPLWYIFALAVNVVVLTSVRRVPPWIVLAVLAALSVAVQSTQLGWPMLWKVPENVVFFALGVYGGGILQAVAARRRLTDLVLAMIVALGFVVVARWRVGVVADSVEDLFRDCACIVVGAAFVAQVVRWRPLAVVGAFVGRRTLQIYLLHVPLLLLLLVLLARTGTDWLAGALRYPLVDALWPIGLTLVTVMLALLIHRVLERIGLRALFDPPAAYARVIMIVHSRLKAKCEPGATVRVVEPAATASIPLEAAEGGEHRTTGGISTPYRSDIPVPPSRPPASI